MCALLFLCVGNAAELPSRAHRRSSSMLLPVTDSNSITPDRPVPRDHSDESLPAPSCRPLFGTQREAVFRCWGELLGGPVDAFANRPQLVQLCDFRERLLLHCSDRVRAGVACLSACSVMALLDTRFRRAVAVATEPSRMVAERTGFSVLNRPTSAAYRTTMIFWSTHG